MKKTIIAFFILSLTYTAFSQKEKYKLDEATIKQKLENIPVVDGSIKFDEIIVTDSSLKREQLFIKIRQWFVENFMDSKNVLEVNDISNGLLTGKGSYHYTKSSFTNIHEGYVTFIINASIKDGKFRYQLYDFVAYGTNTNLFAGVNNFSNATKQEIINLDDQYKNFKSGKQVKYAKKYLEDMVILEAGINTSLKELASKKAITDF